MDAGFVRAGFRCLGAFDIDEVALGVHKQNLRTPVHVVDLREASRAAIVARGVPDVVVAGSPCQGFSTVGRRDLHDPRNSLLLRAGELALEVRPKAFVAENVAGALSGDHSKYWIRLEKMMRSDGYQTTTVRLNAASMGIAQQRSRLIMLAWRVQRDPHFAKRSVPAATLREVLRGLSGATHHDERMLEHGSRQHMIARRIGSGQKLCNVRGGESAVHTWQIPEVFGRTNSIEREVLEATLVLRRRDRVRDFGDADPVAVRTISKELGWSSGEIVNGLVRKGYMRRVDGNVDLMHTFNGKYRRLSLDEVSVAVDTKFGDASHFLHPLKDRAFTVREAARIQGFPDQFSFSESEKQNFKMIGNAVPPPMGHHVALCVQNLL